MQIRPQLKIFDETTNLPDVDYGHLPRNTIYISAKIRPKGFTWSEARLTEEEDANDTRDD